MRQSRLGKLLVVLIGLTLLLGLMPGGQEVSLAATTTLPGTGMACFRGLDTINARLTELVNDYPALTEVVDIGDSWEKTNSSSAPGSDLQVLRITNEAITGVKPAMFVVSGLDSRDILGVELNLRFAERLLTGYGIDPDITMVLDTSEVHLLIVANPDGREELERQFASDIYGTLTWQTAWGHNRNLTACHHGVDLTRNFALDYPTGTICGEDYMGTGAESEPETQAIAELLRDLYTDLRETPNSAVDEDAPGLVINLSEWDEMPHIVYPYYSGYQADPLATKDWIYLLASKLANVPGTSDFFKAQLGSENKSSNYGNVVDYAYGELGVPALTFRFEKSIYANKFPKCSEFEGDVVNTWMEALLVASRAVPRPFEFGQGPEFMPRLYVDPPTLPFYPVWVITSTSFSQYYQELPEDKYPADPFSLYATKNAPPWRPDAVETGSIMVAFPTPPHVQTFMALVPFDGSAGVDQELVFFQAGNMDGKLGIPRAVFLRGPFYLALPVISR